MNRYLWYAAALLLATPGAVTAQQNQDALRRIAAAELRADAVGVPVSLLKRKVDEGAAKGIGLDRVALAVEAQLDALVRAREILADAGRTGSLETQELTAVADALRAGVEPGELRTLLGTAPPSGSVLATTVLASLVGSGQSSGRALAMVQGALPRGPEALLGLVGGAGGQFAAGAPGFPRQVGEAELRRRLDPTLGVGDSPGSIGVGGNGVVVNHGPRRGKP
ncbi:MAG: hypothetical protein JO040_08580 [Gemmatimonadetes bacterium]|nr:hypothetical protein [Gemmatimonadota bacterium]